MEVATEVAHQGVAEVTAHRHQGVVVAEVATTKGAETGAAAGAGAVVEGTTKDVEAAAGVAQDEESYLTKWVYIDYIDFDQKEDFATLITTHAFLGPQFYWLPICSISPQ
ncbi:hypothetical protein FGO68_gene16321 [Halteria grandinella]|uniref:Uncharacterized protein n=1 Tax=Halteria grandinella TaxID=5974 RepID=A0A8J8NJB5_HALGN|nr:hypothetical protein FGO68_gene16321 [Halteria grandinella]